MPVAISHANPEDVEEVMDLIESSIEGKDPKHCVMAFLALSIILQKPHASREEVIMGVQGASEWIALFLSKVDEMDGSESKVTLN